MMFTVLNPGIVRVYNIKVCQQRSAVMNW